MIRFTCTACSRAFDAPAESAGRKFECSCGQRVQVPTPTNKTVLGKVEEERPRNSLPLWTWMGAAAAGFVLVLIMGIAIVSDRQRQEPLPDGQCPTCGHRFKTLAVHGVAVHLREQTCPNCHAQHPVSVLRGMFGRLGNQR